MKNLTSIICLSVCFACVACGGAVTPSANAPVVNDTSDVETVKVPAKVEHNQGASEASSFRPNRICYYTVRDHEDQGKFTSAEDAQEHMLDAFQREVDRLAESGKLTPEMQTGADVTINIVIEGPTCSTERVALAD